MIIILPSLFKGNLCKSIHRYNVQMKIDTQDDTTKLTVTSYSADGHVPMYVLSVRGLGFICSRYNIAICTVYIVMCTTHLQ